MAEVCLGLGSNIGEKLGNLRAALALLCGDGQSDVHLLAVSSLYRTRPVSLLDQDWFLNAAARIETAFTPRELLKRLLAIEHELGRVRTVRNGPRCIDLDILLWGDLVVAEDDLVIPHARMLERLFVLEPLAEIAAEVRHPVLGKTIAECRLNVLAQVRGETGVLRVEGPAWAGLIDHR